MPETLEALFSDLPDPEIETPAPLDPGLDLDPPAAPEAGTDLSTDGPTCETCSTPIPYSGRGRKPRFCVEHKKKIATGGSKPRASRGTARLAVLETDLTREMVVFGKQVSRVAPITGITLVDRSSRTAAALCKVAAKNEKVLLVLEASTSILPYLDLSETVVAVLLATMIDFGRIDPNAVPAQIFGLTETYNEVNSPPEATVDPAGLEFGNNPVGYQGADHTPQVPPRFQRVEVN